MLPKIAIKWEISDKYSTLPHKRMVTYNEDSKIMRPYHDIVVYGPTYTVPKLHTYVEGSYPFDEHKFLSYGPYYRAKKGAEIAYKNDRKSYYETIENVKTLIYKTLIEKGSQEQQKTLELRIGEELYKKLSEQVYKTLIKKGSQEQQKTLELRIGKELYKKLSDTVASEKYEVASEKKDESPGINLAPFFYKPVKEETTRSI